MAKKDLTIKQRKLIKGIAEGKTHGAAAREAGYSNKTADSIASQQLDKPHVKVALCKLLDKAGVTDERLADKINNLMEAKKTVSAVSGKGADAGSVDFIDVDDNVVQFNATKLACQIKGHLIDKAKVDVTHSGSIAAEVYSILNSKDE